MCSLRSCRCVSSLFFKWRRIFSSKVLTKLCAIATIMASMPSLYMQVRQPSNATFLLSLVNCAMSFFMFSYQVHEKSILLPLLPITMLISPSESPVSPSIINMALLTMYPLLVKDGLSTVYWSMHMLCLAFQFIFPIGSGHIKIDTVQNVFKRIRGLLFSPAISMTLVILVHIGCHFLQPLTSKEFLSDAIMVTVGFSYFALHTVMTNLSHLYCYCGTKNE